MGMAELRNQFNINTPQVGIGSDSGKNNYDHSWIRNKA
jgi:hypothetical protein